VAKERFSNQILAKPQEVLPYIVERLYLHLQTHSLNS
jgi:hypothetical protein